ncbi:MAG: septal ring lytic transglycosylase RlpA family protein [Pseudobdellovibrionaceae bacterium]|jgi:rare lipoprotein A|nr:septal ring lytic transglycosylase RlpA family protein [Pseudobdellovibrionaceae bacterium]
MLLINKIKNLVLLLVLPMLLSACSEIEFGSHLVKTWDGDAAPPTVAKGTFKVGKPYTIAGRTYYPKETYNYVETGVASWYGPGFHGKKTASGEQYSQYEMTAAHRTLQMPSLVRVTNLGNGKSVVVRVNDRGPFSKGRIIDVSEKAAGLLDMKGAGTAKVKLELLADESRALAMAAKNGKSTKGVEVAYNQTGRLPQGYSQSSYEPQVAQASVVQSVQSSPVTSYSGPIISDVPMSEPELEQTARVEDVQGHITNGKFYPNAVVQQQPVTANSLYVQAGAFGSEQNAQNLAVRMASIAHTKVEPVTFGGRTLYKVRLGPLDTVRQADSVLSKVLASGQSDAIIVVQ